MHRRLFADPLQAEVHSARFVNAVQVDTFHIMLNRERGPHGKFSRQAADHLTGKASYGDARTQHVRHAANFKR